MRIKIGYADDKSLNRQSFSNKIKMLDGVELVLMANDGNDFLNQLKGLPHAQFPDVAFIDLEMPGMGGIQTIGVCKALYPTVSCVVLTVFDDDDKIFEAIKAGAKGYLLKDESANSIGDAITNILQFGGAPMSPGIARKAFNLLVNAEVSFASSKKNIPEEAGDELLSVREKEILNYTTYGWDAKRIAADLDISVHTVRKHIANIYQKLHVTSKAQIIQLAYKNNWQKNI